MSDKEKVIECLEKAGKGLRLTTIWEDTSIFIGSLGALLDEMEKEGTIWVDRNGGFEYFKLSSP
jgi:hypothetical protein